jgi:hypothetical protein
MGAGGVSVLVTQPADVIKTRMQGKSGHGKLFTTYAVVAVAAVMLLSA